MNSHKTHLSILIGVFLFIVAVRVYVIVESDMRGADDAYITYRYAERIATGKGFTYNDGERVLGVTTPLYATLLALFALVKLPLPVVAQALGILASGLTGVLLLMYSQKIIPGASSLIPPLLYALWPNAISTDISGMEAPLFTLGIMAFFYSLLIARYRVALLVSALCVLLRPEGVLLLILYFLFKYAMERRAMIRDYVPDIVITSVIIFPWVVFSTMYFGSPIPHSISAKLALYAGLEQDGALNRAIDLLHLSSLVGWITVLGALWGIIYSMMRVYWGWLETLFVATVIVALALSSAHLFFWYQAPLTVMLALFLGIGIGGGLKLLGHFAKSKRMIQGVSLMCIISAIPVAGRRFSATLSYNTLEARIYNTERRGVGEYLTQLATTSTTSPVLVAEDIGYPGYYFRGRIIDRDGLVTPSAVTRNRLQEYAVFLEDCLREYPGHWLTVNVDSPTASYIFKSGILNRQYTLDTAVASTNSQGYLLYHANAR